MSNRTVLYSAVDDSITRYTVDVEAGALTREETISVASKVQYAWPHPSRKFLYVSTSNGGPRVKSDQNHVSAYSIGENGELAQHGSPAELPNRAVHICVDPAGRFMVNAHNFERGGLTVHAIETDGSIGHVIAQPNLAFGIYPHQVMVFPSGEKVLIVDRGNKAQPDKAEDPGALRQFVVQRATLTAADVVAPNGGYGFGPRHIDFHPTKPWLYVSDERTNRLYMFRFLNGTIEAEPAYVRATLLGENSSARQLAGPIHVHPSGRFVYLVNRADGTKEIDGRQVFSGGENNIAVYAICPETGEPSLIQHIDTRSFHVRTFACDPSGRLLVCASIKALSHRDQNGLTTTPASLSVFRIANDGRLEFVRTYAVETNGPQLQYWMGMIGLG